MWTMHGALIWLSIGAGFLSGALWLYAASVKVPTNIGSGYGTLASKSSRHFFNPNKRGRQMIDWSIALKGRRGQRKEKQP
jgi:hypothetical protein